MMVGCPEEVYDDIHPKAKENEQELEQMGELLDEHIDWEKAQEIKGKKGGAGKTPTYTKEQLGKIRDEIKENMMCLAQSAGAGNVLVRLKG